MKKNNKLKLNINLNFESLKGAGFGAFIKDSVKKNKNAEIIIDLNCMLNCCVDNKDIKLKDIFSETVLHETMHAIQELFEMNFNENIIEYLIEENRNE